MLEVIRVLREFSNVIPMIGFKPPKKDEAYSIARMFEETVALHGDRPMILFEDREWTYHEFNRLANRYAHFLKAQGLQRGDCIALFMENRPDFLAALLGANKIGVQASLINSSLIGGPLVHCITAASSTKCVFGAELADHVAPILDDLPLERRRDYLWVNDTGDYSCPEWATDLSSGLDGVPDTNLPETEEIVAGETAMYIFTSGTTGLPKGAVVTHRRPIAAGKMMGKVCWHLTPEDRIYICLPLYHTTALLPGVCSCIAHGSSMYLRRHFSASRFVEETRRYHTTGFLYVGELCRYLMKQPEQANDADNPVVKAMGNGLRPDIWDDFKRRFGVERVCEIYGASEGSAAFANLLNKDRTIGMTTNTVLLAQYDVDQDELIRDQNGRVIPVAKGDPGLLLTQLDADFTFDGYTNEAANEQKLVRNALEEGDLWFNTGDLIREIDVGFAMGRAHYQFVDRVGDTFRWRAENVSTNEVAEELNAFDGVSLANVYGVEVEGCEGRAGMVAFQGDPNTFDWPGFWTHVEEHLPDYARPVFVRMLTQVDTTQTFKLVKRDLREQAYHLDKVGDDAIYARMPGTAGYAPLSTEQWNAIRNGTAGF